MRLLLLILFFLPTGMFAQKKLPLACTELKGKLQQIKKSYPLFEKWKKQKTGKDYEEKWTTDFSLCGLKGIVEKEGDDEISLLFDFRDYDDNEKDCEAFIKKLSAAITAVFDHLVPEEDESKGDDMTPDTHFYYWRDYRVFADHNEEVEIAYPGIYSALELRFRLSK
ncbi:MAG: hypothetical protein HYZ15_12445 [Sphingobacteriales bacterium]|nr:hypothetical protein [Sphingobacteriales bacterium]